MSNEVFEQIKEGMDEALEMAGHHRRLQDQTTIVINALQSIALGDPDPQATAKDALFRILDLFPTPSQTERNEG